MGVAAVVVDTDASQADLGTNLIERGGPHGTVRDRHTLLPMGGPFLRKLALGLCTGSRPCPIGRDDAVRALSNRNFGRFLTEVCGS
jgi:hypothetical protein